ncbi:MAG: DUF6465 family protein [Butyrivibrio sp.]|jgi:hypothetical protein|nr:DUF6465 family protein [Butyrivibrio sp.]
MAVKKLAAQKKPAVKKAEAFKANVELQYGDKSISYDEIVQNAKNVWAYDLHKDVSEITSMDLYVKPEEDRVYYVINGSEAGSFMI